MFCEHEKKQLQLLDTQMKNGEKEFRVSPCVMRAFCAQGTRAEKGFVSAMRYASILHAGNASRPRDDH